MRKREPSQRCQEALEFIADYRCRNGYSPSMAEIGASIGVRSRSLVTYYLDRLEDEGMIRREPGIPRSIVIIGG